MNREYVVKKTNILSLIDISIKADLVFSMFEKKYEELHSRSTIKRVDNKWELTMQIWDNEDTEKTTISREALESFNIL